MTRSQGSPVSTLPGCARTTRRRTAAVLAACIVAAAIAVAAPPLPQASATTLLDPASQALASGNSSSRAIWSDGTTMWVMNLGDRIYAYNLADMTHDADKDITTIKAAGNHNANGM